jgi:hypothetical protein
MVVLLKWDGRSIQDRDAEKERSEMELGSTVGMVKPERHTNSCAERDGSICVTRRERLQSGIEVNAGKAAASRRTPYISEEMKILVKRGVRE